MLRPLVDPTDQTLFAIAVLVGFLCSSSCSSGWRASKTDFSRKFDAVFADWKASDPGGAAAVLHQGEIIYEKYFGLADLEKNEAFGPKTITDIGSISKQFTACIIALLEEEERLSIDDKISKHLPDLPYLYDSVRIKHLIHHTSGVKDYEALLIIRGQHYFGEDISNRTVIDLLRKQASLNFAPGSEFEYSNSNYILLTEIIERLESKPINEVAAERIFRPLGMSSTFFHINQGDDFPNRAIGYQNGKDGFQRPAYSSHLVGDGGLYTTLADLIKWDQNFYDNILGNKRQSFLTRLQYREPLDDGSNNNMAFAQIVSDHGFGERSWSHGGSGGGYRSFYIRFEDSEFSAIVLTNADDKNAFDKSNEIVNIFFDVEATNAGGNVPNTRKVEPDFLPVDAEMKQEFSGYYLADNDLSAVQISWLEADQNFRVKWLMNHDGGYPARALTRLTLGEMDDPSYTYTYDPETSQLTHHENALKIEQWKKLDQIQHPLTTFSGTYYSQEVDHQLTIKVSDAGLACSNMFLKSLTRIGDLVFWDELTSSVISFTFKEKSITGFSISIPRGDRSLRDLRFAKQSS